jgi:hypothetical protein
MGHNSYRNDPDIQFDRFHHCGDSVSSGTAASATGAAAGLSASRGSTTAWLSTIWHTTTAAPVK